MRVSTLQVIAERTTHLRNECAGLLKRQRESIQLLSQFVRFVGIARVSDATILRALAGTPLRRLH